ncbi:hypothetical protein ACIBUY_30475 [Streptomyces sp. NPDC050085]|uniref:hypothetical protein n=1 Tax=Streptomyces sp. NPDC050085 TaxID=3365600 RepID=UPI0037AEA8D6
MTDNKHEADHERVSQQNSFTNFAQDIEDNRKGGGWVNGIFRAAVGATPVGQALAGRKSDFEDRDLNAMLDMVHQTNPEDLEASGTALWDARDAIKSAASELDGHITKVHWVGESGDSFRQWGGKLVTYAEQLSTYAGSAGDQLSAASSGLASVRSAMPPRDTRLNAGQRPSQIPVVKQVEGNKEYEAAVAVEKDRQEAINQMNRLSSYYVVSAEQLETLQKNPPKLEAMPDVGVPKPSGGAVLRRRGGASGSSDGTTEVTTGSQHSSDGTTHPQVDSTGTTTPPAKHATGTITYPDRPVGTEINSIDTLPSPTTTPPTTGPTPVTSGPNLTGPSATGYSNGYVPPVTSTTGRTMGPTGTRTPFSAQGRSGGTSGTNNSGTPRSMGRGGTSEMGRSGSTARTGGTTGKTSPMTGRGISGGTPRATGGTTPRTSGGTGAGRNGVVGGRPTNSRPGATGQNGSRIPRGSVMGASESAGNGRSTAGRVGQRGVIGAPGSTGKQAGPNAAGARNGMTRGGAGLVRGPGKNDKPHEEETDAAERPDYVVEDPNTHLPANRRDVPPVVN